MINMDFDAYSDVEEMEVEVVEHLKEEQVEEISSVEVREEDSIILNTLLVNTDLDIVEGQAQEVAVSYLVNLTCCGRTFKNSTGIKCHRRSEKCPQWDGRARKRKTVSLKDGESQFKKRKTWYEEIEGDEREEELWNNQGSGEGDREGENQREEQRAKEGEENGDEQDDGEEVEPIHYPEMNWPRVRIQRLERIIFLKSSIRREIMEIKMERQLQEEKAKKGKLNKKLNRALKQLHEENQEKARHEKELKERLDAKSQVEVLLRLKIKHLIEDHHQLQIQNLRQRFGTIWCSKYL